MSQCSLFVGIGFPFVDLRRFVTEPTYQLAVPRFPLAKPREFIRSFGPVETRLGGGVDEWAGEEVYGRAATALRFPNRLGWKPFGTDLSPLVANFSFRRFYSDGLTSRLEIGIRLNARDGDPFGDPFGFQPFDPAGCLGVIRQCFSLLVRVPSGEPGAWRPCSLIEAGRLLAEHLLRSTTARPDRRLPPVEKWWLQAGDPVLLFHYRPTELLTGLPPHSKEVQISPGQDFSIAYGLIEHNGTPVRSWFLGSSFEAEKDRLRRLRIHLFRLHTEREGVKSILRQIHRKRITAGASDALADYLDQVVNLIQRPQRFGLDQAALIDSAKYLVDLVAPGERATILAELEQTRKSLFHKVRRLTEKSTDTAKISIILNNSSVGAFNTGDINLNDKSITFGDNTTVHGNFTVTVAETIQRSFNGAAESNAPDDLKEELKTLAMQVAEMVKQLPPQQGEQAARDLEALTQEAISPQPRRKWYELSGEGLIEAATTVGKIAAPVISTVRTILTLLAH